MTELSKDKTKRKMAGNLLTYGFTFETTFFLPIAEQAQTNTEAVKRLREALKKAYTFPMLWIISCPKPNPEAIKHYHQNSIKDIKGTDLQARLTVFSTERLKGVRQLEEIKGINEIFEIEMDIQIRHKEITDADLEELAGKIQRRARMTDLKAGFVGKNIRRYGLINKPKED